MAGRLGRLDTGEDRRGTRSAFIRAHGGDDALVAALARLFGGYGRFVTPIPESFRRIQDGERIRVGTRDWQVVVGTGHAPEHACLYCAETGVLISGDQVLPRISTIVSVWESEPEADPLRAFLTSLDKLAALPADTLVLPSHGAPFRGLHARIRALQDHHAARLDETLAACAAPRTAAEVLPVLFTRALDPHQKSFAIGETLAHLNYLISDGKLVRRRDAAGIFSFQAAERQAQALSRTG